MNAEGDTSIREDTLEGLGTKTYFLKLLFGAVFSIAAPPRSRTTATHHIEKEFSPPTTFHNETTNIELRNTQTLNSVESVEDAYGNEIDPNHSNTHMMSKIFRPRPQQELTHEVSQKLMPSRRPRLTEILPDPGYFAAGAIAGIFSRTATAPIDRLKVYLIANVSTKSAPLEAVKQGNATAAAKLAGQPLVAAIKELWNAGGIRSLFAGPFLSALNCEIS